MKCVITWLNWMNCITTWLNWMKCVTTYSKHFKFKIRIINTLNQNTSLQLLYRLSNVLVVTKSVELNLCVVFIVEPYTIVAAFPSTVLFILLDLSCTMLIVVFLIIIDVPTIIKVVTDDFSLLFVDSSTDYLHKACQEQFNVRSH